MPIIFVGHGHPINALLNTDFNRSLTKMGQTIEKPAAILVISAHWETVGTYVSVNAVPRTIHDFGRFDDRLYEMTYPDSGHPEQAKELKGLVSLTDIMEDGGMGLDHGA